MSTIYTVKVNKSTDFSLAEKDLYTIDFVNNGSKYHILQNNKSFHAEITKDDFGSKKYEVVVNGNKYEVAIKNELDVRIAAMGFTIGKSKKVNEIKAPMPGLILDIAVKVGQRVKENEVLLILEAMKMENSISSPRDGVIESIDVQIGDAVDKASLLLKFED